MLQLMNLNYLLLNPWIIFLIVAWVLPWKGVALWLSARRHQKIWFIAILIFNTLAILEIIYIFFYANKIKPEVSDHEK